MIPEITLKNEITRAVIWPDLGITCARWFANSLQILFYDKKYCLAYDSRDKQPSETEILILDTLVHALFTHHEYNKEKCAYMCAERKDNKLILKTMTATHIWSI